MGKGTVNDESLIREEIDLRPYFKELVEGAVVNQKLEVTDLSRFYLVNLLNQFAKTDQLFEGAEGNHEETPLAILLSRALDSDPATRIKTFKKLGDIALYVSGYFSDYIDSKLVDIDYYISMGEGAYGNLSGLFANEKTFGSLYQELSIKFVGLMGVLSEVRDAAGISSNTDLIKLYERWLKTGDPKIKERLEKEGITPCLVNPKNH